MVHGVMSDGGVWRECVWKSDHEQRDGGGIVSRAV